MEKRKRYEENNDSPIIRPIEPKRPLKWIPKNFKTLFCFSKFNCKLCSRRMTPDHLLKEYKNATNIEIDDTEDLIKRMSKKSIKEKRS
jgi:hypothetical protein